MLGGTKDEAPLPNFGLYHLRVYTLRSPNSPQAAGTRVIVGYPKSEVTRISKGVSSEANEEESLKKLHRRKSSEIHLAFTTLIGSDKILEQRTQPQRLVVPYQWLDPNAVTPSKICIWRENEAFGLPSN